MGIQLLQELFPYVKEAMHKTAGVAKFLCLLHVTSTYICRGAKPVGPSMLLTFKDGDVVLAEKITSHRGKVGSGDAVLIRSPEDPTKVMIKRVKGVEGDVVSYALDPQNSNELKTVVRIAVIRDSLFQFLMHLYIPEFSLWYGLQRISDQLATRFCDF